MHSIELIKINTTDAFIPHNINERLKATSMHYLEPFFRPDDPKALFIPINEFSYSISCDSQDLTSACYWIEWIIEYEILHKKMKEHIVCSARENIDVDELFQSDSIWIVWDSIMHYSKEKPLFVQNLLSSLLNLFCMKYTTTICKKRRYILYYAVGILIENVKTDIDISDDKETLSNVVNKTNIVYLQIKKNEDNTIIRSESFIDKRKRAEVSMKKLEMIDGALLR
jgi:hypothetical protein